MRAALVQLLNPGWRLLYCNSFRGTWQGDALATLHRPGSFFVTTHWSVVLEDERRPPRRWPLWNSFVAFIGIPFTRTCVGVGIRRPDAQDLTQEFFARLLERNWLARANQAKGRFRTFLLRALERFLANEWDKVRALKRGGGQKRVPLQFETGETRYSAEPADLRTPEQVFECRWAVALLGEVMQRLETEYQQEGKAELFTALEPCLVGDRERLPYPQLAEQLGQNEGAVRVAVHRLRQRYRDLLRAEIALTVASPEDVDAEMRHLFNVLAQGGMENAP